MNCRIDQFTFTWFVVSSTNSYYFLASKSKHAYDVQFSNVQVNFPAAFF